MAWRYPVFAEPSGAYLGELALTGVEVTRTLSGPGRLTGRVLPGQDPALLRPWHVSIWAEDEAGTIRGGGFLAPADWTADAATIDCIGRSGYPQSMPWTGDPYEGIQVDPLDVVRRIWAHLQAQPGGDIGVVVDATTSPVRIGTAAIFKDATGKVVPTPDFWTDASGAKADPPAFWKVGKGTPARSPEWWTDADGKKVATPDYWVDGNGQKVAAPPDPTKPPTGWKHYTWDSPPPGWNHWTAADPDFWTDQSGKVQPAPSGTPSGWMHYTKSNPPPSWTWHDPTKPPTGWKHWTAKKLPEGWTKQNAEPVALDWWSTADLGRVIDDLAAATPFDYLEHTAWDGERLAHRLQLGHPTIGVRRSGVRFALGENLALTPSLDGDDGDYATEVHALGAGEGQAMVRAPRITRDTSGVRRVAIHVDKTARSASMLAASARQALGFLTGDGRVQQVTVTEHPHAPLGSFDVGDEVYLTGTDGLVTLDRWVRIVALTIRPEDTTSMVLDVQEV